MLGNANNNVVRIHAAFIICLSVQSQWRNAKYKQNYTGVASFQCIGEADFHGSSGWKPF
jgi:hypothetical protein